MSSGDGVYDFSGKQIYCFSDLEGRIPAYPAKGKVPNVARVLEIIKSSKDGNSNKSLRNDEAVVFTGDLIDRGPENIKLMQKMIALKGNVLLCMGNRDLNKIRLIDEYFIVKGDGVPCWVGSSASDFKALCTEVANGFGEGKTYKFKYDYEQLAGPMIGTQQAGWTGFTREFLAQNIFLSDLKGRVTAVEENTLGRFLHKQYAIEEFNALFGAGIFGNDDTNNGVLHAAIAIMSMVMGCIWPKGHLPEYLEPYNGLYIEYLKRCHVIGAFKAADGKYGVASHAGLPSNDGGFLLTDTLMTEAVGDESVSFIEAIIAIEVEKNNILEKFAYSPPSTAKAAVSILPNSFPSNGSNTGKSPSQQVKNAAVALGNVPFRDREGVTKLIHLSICGVPEGVGYTSALSPVTYMSKLSADGPKALAKKTLSVPEAWGGGMRKHRGGVNKVKFVSSVMTFYNIFGHQPAGYVPEVSIVNTGENAGQVRNVCLDISKAESIGDANKVSMALLVLNSGQEGDIMEGIVNIQDRKENEHHGVYTYHKKFEEYNIENSDVNGVLMEREDGKIIGTSYTPASFLKNLHELQKQAGGKKGSYSSRTLKELQSVAKKRGVVYSGLNKGDLIRKLREGVAFKSK